MILWYAQLYSKRYVKEIRREYNLPSPPTTCVCALPCMRPHDHGPTVSGHKRRATAWQLCPSLKGPCCHLEWWWWWWWWGWGGVWIGVTTNFDFSFPKTWTVRHHWSERWGWSVRPVTSSAQQLAPVGPLPSTSQTGEPQRTCKNSFRLLLTSNTNQTWWVPLVDDHKQGNEPCTHK
jgi:hypothetical protein